MKNILLFEEFLFEKEEMISQKKAALDFVEKQGSATWKEIQNFLLVNKGLDPNDRSNRGNMSSYFSGGSFYLSHYYPKGETPTGRNSNSHGLLMIPTKKDPRYLEKDKTGKYTVKIWDGKSKLDEGFINDDSLNENKLKLAIDKMDKWMPEDPEIQDEYYQLINDKDIKGMIELLDMHADEDVLMNLGIKYQDLEKLAKEIINGN